MAAWPKVMLPPLPTTAMQPLLHVTSLWQRFGSTKPPPEVLVDTLRFILNRSAAAGCQQQHHHTALSTSSAAAHRPRPPPGELRKPPILSTGSPSAATSGTSAFRLLWIDAAARQAG
mmetsp:Transcript_36978/g.104375  ORF Transcript_36978/g.104375 Transcript_36978/m.104375 type:complete len:117 (+) Transcript_36978:984-1334(+)